MKPFKIKKSNDYLTYNLSYPIGNITVKMFIDLWISKIAVRFKDYWFDNWFGREHKIMNFKLREKLYFWNKWRNKFMFHFGQFIIHKVFKERSFAKFIKEKKEL